MRNNPEERSPLDEFYISGQKYGNENSAVRH